MKFLGSLELPNLTDGVTKDSFHTTAANLDELFKKSICSELGLMLTLRNSFIEMVRVE